MRTSKYSDDLNTIKNRYKYKIIQQSYVIDNLLNYQYFFSVTENVDLDRKLKDLEQKMENKNINEIQKSKNKKLLESLKEQFNDIKIKGKANYDYSNQLLLEVEKDYYKNKTKKGIDEIYDKICRGIIDSAVEQYIKLEKSIIIIFENYKSLALSK